MRIFRSPMEAGRHFPGAVVAIGKFDGFHRGHLRLLKAALKRARELKTACVVLTFDPAPEQFLRLFPSGPLLPLAKRLEFFGGLGIDGVVLLPFDHELACLSPEGFARNVLSVQLKPVSVCVGSDFCFGRDRAGSVETLKELGASLGFLVQAVRLLKADGKKVSAERIHALLEKGAVRKAETLLGRRIAR